MGRDSNNPPVEAAVAPPAGVSGRQAHAPPPNWRVGFWSLIVTQFQGAFNDNALKFLVIYLIIERGFPERDRFVLLVGALFALPFIFFSLAGGWIDDASYVSTRGT